MNENQETALNAQNDVVTNADATIESHLPNKVSLTKEEIIDKLQSLHNQDEIPTRQEIEGLKQAFYRLRSAELSVLKNDFVEAGNNEADFVIPTDNKEEEIKSLLSQIKDKRAKALEEEEKEKERNLEQKLTIIERLKALTENNEEDFNKLYREFKDLQQQWNTIKLVPATSVNDLWKSYQIYTEKFYDLIKMNNEFRDYDFKKNLEMKTTICESVEKLATESDVVSAFHQLQNFHQQWREIGPVAKEIREDLWNRFKEASTEINKKYQAHFEELKAKEENNLIEKKAICDALRNIDYSLLKTFKDWDQKSKEVLELQAKWKTIGFVPRKENNQIFEEYRALCDTFFEKKANHFKLQRDEMEDNLRLKQKLVAKAEELKDSKDWRKTTDEVIALQKEWKTIGPVSRKYSDAIWNQFVTACDYFFDQKKQNVSSHKEEELENLAKKKDVITKIHALSEITDSAEAMPALRALMDEWHAIGFVPFKEKDKIYKEYQSALDDQFDRLKLDKSERRMQSFKANLEDIVSSEKPKARLIRERDKNISQYNRVKSDLQTYENNMGFLSISKKANGLFKDMEHKMQGLRDELELIDQKIKTINEQLKNID